MKYYDSHLVWLKYFTYHLVPVLALNCCKQHYCHQLKLEKYVILYLNFMSDVYLNLIRWRGREATKHLWGGGGAIKVCEPLL
jgi:hypothetical protein